MAALPRAGDSTGENTPFYDEKLHEVVGTADGIGVKNAIKEVREPGYMTEDGKVLKRARVIVYGNTGPSPDKPPDGAEGSDNLSQGAGEPKDASGGGTGEKSGGGTTEGKKEDSSAEAHVDAMPYAVRLGPRCEAIMDRFIEKEVRNAEEKIFSSAFLAGGGP